MTRVWFARGLRGMIAKRIQLDLFRQGFVAGPPATFVDGDFGGATEAAVKQLQSARGLAPTGSVDDATWRQLTADPLPSLFERCLSLTAAFEGHGFGLLQGNFDGAGLTWGIIGFTLASGGIQAVLAAAEAQAPGTLDRTLGPLADEWARVVKLPRPQQLAWADALSTGPAKVDVPKPWRDAFAALGEQPAVKLQQMQQAYDRYFVPCAGSGRRLLLRSELGIALAFDVHVQNGGFKGPTIALADALSPDRPEPDRRRAIANSVADLARPQWQADVRSRKLCIAAGEGGVHGRAYRLAAWGLAEVDAA